MSSTSVSVPVGSSDTLAESGDNHSFVENEVTFPVRGAKVHYFLLGLRCIFAWPSVHIAVWNQYRHSTLLNMPRSLCSAKWAQNPSRNKFWGEKCVEISPIFFLLQFSNAVVFTFSNVAVALPRNKLSWMVWEISTRRNLLLVFSWCQRGNKLPPDVKTSKSHKIETGIRSGSRDKGEEKARRMPSWCWLVSYSSRHFLTPYTLLFTRDTTRCKLSRLASNYTHNLQLLAWVEETHMHTTLHVVAKVRVAEWLN